jgi:hypothetical protein
VRDGPSATLKCEDDTCSMVGGEEHNLFFEFRGGKFVMFIGSGVKIGLQR